MVILQPGNRRAHAFARRNLLGRSLGGGPISLDVGAHHPLQFQ